MVREHEAVRVLVVVGYLRPAELGVPGEVFRVQDAVEAVHLAAVDRQEPGHEAVLDVVRRDVDPGLQRDGLGLAVDPDLAGGRAVRTGVLPEEVIEAPVLVHDEDDVLDRVLAREEAWRSGGGGGRGRGPMTGRAGGPRRPQLPRNERRDRYREDGDEDPPASSGLSPVRGAAGSGWAEARCGHRTKDATWRREVRGPCRHLAYRSAVILPKVRDPRFVTIRRGGTLTDPDHQLLALWAAACAEHVLSLYESAQPADPR